MLEIIAIKTELKIVGIFTPLSIRVRLGDMGITVGAKILVKNDDAQKAVEILESAIETNSEQGDLYYILAQIYKMQSNTKQFIKNMNLALKNNSTLTIAPKQVKKELDEFWN